MHKHLKKHSCDKITNKRVLKCCKIDQCLHSRLNENNENNLTNCLIGKNVLLFFFFLV